MRARVPFTKMSGAGNDFVVLDGEVWAAIRGDRAAWVSSVCRRGVSVGADGVLVVSGGRADRVHVEFFNPDGGEAFCGNGSRCAARYAVTRGLTPGPSMNLSTFCGEVPAEVEGARVRLTLPPPEDLGAIALSIAGATFLGRRVGAGVPHVVFPVQNLEAYPLESVGPALRRHASLGPAGANVNLVERDASDRIRVRTFERGVEGETLSCGTGALAVALAARLGGAPETVIVVPRSGLPLTVLIAGDPRQPDAVQLTGDARLVFEGVLDPEGIAERLLDA